MFYMYGMNNIQLEIWENKSCTIGYTIKLSFIFCNGYTFHKYETKKKCDQN